MPNNSSKVKWSEEVRLSIIHVLLWASLSCQSCRKRKEGPVAHCGVGATPALPSTLHVTCYMCYMPEADVHGTANRANRANRCPCNVADEEMVATANRRTESFASSWR